MWELVKKKEKVTFIFIIFLKKDAWLKCDLPGYIKRKTPSFFRIRGRELGNEI